MKVLEIKEVLFKKVLTVCKNQLPSENVNETSVNSIYKSLG